jgi:hypothetical protein
MPKQALNETATITKAAANAAKDNGRLPIQFISPGWGSSGYYSPEVIEQAVSDRVIPAGTHMYADHPTDAEDIERPARSIKDLMAVVAEDATLSADGAMVGLVDVVPQWRDMFKSSAVTEAIGVSIRGSATDIVEGEAEGRRGGIIEGLVAPVLSVDFVTRAGRGGKVLSVLESARANTRAIGRGISEATVNDTREALVQVLRDAYPSAEDNERGHWVYVRDFDDSTVWFEIEGSDDAGIYGQAYTSTDGAVALSGDRAEVRVVTTYVPATRPDSTNPTTEESEEDPMAEVRIEETELARLRDVDGRVTTLESERDTAVQQRDEVTVERDQLRARESAVTHARTRITTANAGLPASTVDRIVAESTRTVPVTDAGVLDTTALDTAVDTARTAEESYLAGLAEAAGVGSISGFGGAPAGDPVEITESELDASVGGAFGRQVKEA